jgi:hypothetical protein
VFEFGTSLREARTRRGIELGQAEQATKIRGKYLRALEDEQFGLLPSETYVKGFLRTYAEYLGLDGQLYVDEYNSRFAAAEDSDLRPRRSPERRDRRLEARIVLVVLAVIAIVTVIVISAWTSSGKHSAFPPPKTPVKAAARGPVPGLAITAVRGPSYVAIHRGGASGKVLFQGTIGRGQTEPFLGRSFWMTVSAPENLVIRVRGKKIHVGGYRPRVIRVTPTTWKAD